MTRSLLDMTPDEMREEAQRRWENRKKNLPLDTPVRPARPVAPKPTVTIAPSAPLTIILPFDLLVSDNERSLPVVMKRGGRTFPRLVLNRAYKVAKQKIRDEIRAALKANPDFRAWEQPVIVTATFHEPNTSRKRDITNWCKQLGDACSGLLYDDDWRVTEAVYRRGPVDAEWPRVVLTVRPA